jgi:hypothetical protein
MNFTDLVEFWVMQLGWESLEVADTGSFAGTADAIDAIK